MNRAEYLQARADMTLIVALIRELPLETFVQRNTQARVAGPVQDPKFWPGNQYESAMALQNDFTLASAMAELRDRVKGLPGA